MGGEEGFVLVKKIFSLLQIWQCLVDSTLLLTLQSTQTTLTVHLQIMERSVHVYLYVHVQGDPKVAQDIITPELNIK